MTNQKTQPTPDPLDTITDIEIGLSRAAAKLESMADLICHALESGQGLCVGTEQGIGYLLDDMAKDIYSLNAQNLALFSVVNTAANNTKTELQAHG